MRVDAEEKIPNQTPSSSVEMEFTEDEKMWLVNIAAEIPDGDLLPKEKFWHDVTKPQTSIEAELFQLKACAYFGLSNSINNNQDLDTKVKDSKITKKMKHQH